MIEDTLRKIARQIMALNEDCLTALLPKYKERMLRFTPTPEWEESFLIYFFINGVRIKNSQFNEKIREHMAAAPEGEKGGLSSRPKLRLVKSRKASPKPENKE